MRLFLLFTVSFLFVLLFSCKKYQAAKDAFYIRAKNVQVATTNGQGSGSHKITDLWLYVNGKYKGAYPVGNLMPIISEGKPVSLNVFAGIKNNGISDTRIFYPMYEFLTLDTTVESGKTIERDFTFQYKASTNFTWTENFESNGYSIVKGGPSEVNFKIAKAEDSFEGKSMELSLNDSTYIAEVQSAGSGFELPIGSSNVYLEVDYKCNQDFTIGLIGEDGTYKPAIGLNPSASWNKIYIQLSNAVSTPPTFTKYKVYFRLLKKTVLTPSLFLDNIKLVFLE